MCQNFRDGRTSGTEDLVRGVISFLCSEVGRGHPFYLDGVVRALAALEREDLIARRSSVFEVSRGLSLAAWKSVLLSYRMAGWGGPAPALYRLLRGRVDYDRRSLLLEVLGRDLRRWAGDSGLVVVDHPLLVGALGGRPDVWYVHGELVAPRESVVRGAARIFVPQEEVAAAFVRSGASPSRLVVTGLCIEPELALGAADQRSKRRQRIGSTDPLTLAFFSSGAEPRPHVRLLATAAFAVARSGHRAIVFADRGGRLERAFRRRPRGSTMEPELVGFSGRGELDRLTAERFPTVDVVVAPPHERSSWALALGVPFFLVGPDIGPYAPRNRALLLEKGVAVELRSEVDAAELPRRLDALRRSGALLRLSERGEAGPLGGFEKSARHLAEEAARRT